MCEVSVIVPVYNGARVVLEAIQSALDQTAPSLEVLVVDDASTDGTPPLLKSIRDSRVRVLRWERNRGPAAARNLAVSRSNGEWVAFLDADDWMEPGRIARLLQAARIEAADMVADLTRLYSGDRGVWRDSHPGLHGRGVTEVNLESLCDHDLGAVQPMIRRGFLLEHRLRHDPTLRYAEDFDFYARCLLAGARFVVLGEAMYWRRLAPGSLSRSVGLGYPSVAASTRRLLRTTHGARMRGARRLLRRRLAGALGGGLRHAARHRDWRVAVRTAKAGGLWLLAAFPEACLSALRGRRRVSPQDPSGRRTG